MKFNISMRIKVFMIAVILILTGEIIYSNKNVESFQKSYVESLKAQCIKLGGFLKSDVEYVLNLGIPITKLIRLEETLKEILNAAPEIEFIEITDLKKYVIYYADHKNMKRVDPGTKVSKTIRFDTTHKLKKLGMAPDEIDTILPIIHSKKNEQVGLVIVRLSPELIISKSREIFFDMITVILTSLLITFEFMTFFVIYSIGVPLENVVRDIHSSVLSLSPVTGRSFLFMSELGNVIESFNKYIEKLVEQLRIFIFFKRSFPEIQKKIKKSVTQQLETINKIQKPIKESFLQIEKKLFTLQEKMDKFAENLSSNTFSVKEPDLKKIGIQLDDDYIPYSYIRPLIFLFLMADGFCTSFMPMYIGTLYQPIMGFSKEMIIGFPMSFYMFFFALSMLFTGTWSDNAGWYKPLMIGIICNAAGLILTFLSQNILQLIIFRSLTAAGFGIVFMAGQRFVIENTSIQSRTVGMASFLASFFSGDMCGTVIGGMLADRIGYRGVFIVAGIISISAFFWSLSMFQNDIRRKKQLEFVKSKEKTRMPFSFLDIFKVLKDKEFSALVLLQAIPAKIILIGFLYYFVPIYLRKIGTLQSDIGRLIMCYSIAMVFFGPLFSKYIEKEEYRRYYVFTGGLITGISMLIFYFYTGFFPLLFIVIMLGLAQTLSVSSQASFIIETNIVKKLGTGTGMGLYRFWERIGNISGPLIMGFAIAKLGYEQAVVIFGIMSIISSFVYFALIFKWKKIK